jgi:hypothetical protein
MYFLIMDSGILEITDAEARLLREDLGAMFEAEKREWYWAIMGERLSEPQYRVVKLKDGVSKGKYAAVFADDIEEICDGMDC